jgi:hypothetical protein
MNKILLFCVALLVASCAQKTEIKADYNPSSFLTDEEIDDFKYEVIRYVGKLAGKANHDTKFEERFDEYYTDLANRHQLLYYFENEDNGEVYFLITRIAPSLHYRKVGFGGKLIRNSENEITQYEEAFRTWKMEEEELKEKSLFLFDRYVNGKDLTAYYPENSKGEEYIEFPNKDVFYDIEKRQWISTLENPMQGLYEERKLNTTSED